MNRIFTSVIVLAVIILSVSCSRETSDQAAEPSEQTSQFISAHTHGIVSREAVIRVRFTNDMADSAMINQPMQDLPISFRPKIKGVGVWSDSRTLEFRPEERLKDGKKYEASIKMTHLFAEQAPKEFTFSFVAMKQSIEVRVNGLQAKDGKELEIQQLTGVLKTADVEHAIDIQKCLTASQNNHQLPMQWSHDENRMIHTFTVDSISRGNEQGIVKLVWDGAPIEADEKGSRQITVPALGSFAVSKVEPVQNQQQYVQIWFTDPLQRNQNLQGLIRIDSAGRLNTTIDGNVIKVYSQKNLGGSKTITIEPGIRNTFGDRLGKSMSFDIQFSEVNPQVRFAGKGVIIPATQGTTIPIEAVNLKSIVVEAVRVYEKNMPQFFQVNSLQSNAEMKRVGRVIWRKRVSLNTSSDNQNGWVGYGLDLQPLVSEHPNGLYHLKVYFTRADIVNQCANSDSFSQELPPIMNDNWESTKKEKSYWDYWEMNIDWQEYRNNSDNPCHPAFYMPRFGRDVSVSRNVLISDIGLIAKTGDNNDMHIAATSIESAQPVEGAEIRVYDYQQQVLGSGKTGRDGMIRIETTHRPFLVVASHNNQKGYLKLDNRSALSVSHFDVVGQKVNKGVKGYIYGERGVWRPGDSLFLTFILDDNDNPLPDNHPVKFSLRNARNQLVTTHVTSKSENGFHCFRIGTDEDAPTGNWKASVEVGGVSFDKMLKVETIKPNRLKIMLDMGDDKSYLSGGSMQATLEARWLHGAVAKNLDADMTVSFTPRATGFSRFTEFVFDDPSRRYETEEEKLFDGTLDQNGKASISAHVDAGGVSPGMLTANFKTRVEEPGGGHSVDRFSLPYHPYERYIGIKTPKGDKARGMLLTDTMQTVSLAALDREGKPVSSARVEVQIFKIRWRWWWEKGQESLADYVGTRSYKAIMTDTVDISKGMGRWQFKIKYPQWGRYLVRARDLDGKHSTGQVVYIDWPGWAGRAQKDTPGGASVLTFASDKQEYSVGEKVSLTIPTGQKGRALVSIESGSRVLRTQWVESRGEVTRHSFEATAEMAPNVYAHVTYLQPHLQAGNDLPIRMYGVIPIRVINPQTRLQPVLQSPDEFRPETEATVRISEESGRPMTYTLAVVDEGLLDLTRFATPDPWGNFYKREALGVKTWDLFDLVAGAYGGKFEKLLAIGGGGGEAEPGSRKANRFPPMVRFMGPFNLDKNKTNSHTIDIPQYVGSVRVMVIAGSGGAYGATDKAVFVRKPLMVTGTLPRVLGPGEEVTFPATVFALKENVRNVAVSLKTEGPLEIAGEAEQRITFTEIGDRVVNFALKAGSGAGPAKVSVTATGAGQRAQQDIEIDVRAHGVPITDVVDTTLESGQTWVRKVKFPGIAGTNSAFLEVSRIPPINLGKRLNWLIRYPHGCIEQTTSSAFPQVYLNKLLRLSPQREKQVENNVKAGIQRLKMFQTSSGGFGYWPGQNHASEWGTNYVGHFMVEAKLAGYRVPSGMLGQWKQHQRTRALSWTAGRTRSELSQAYRLYTLALAGDPQLSAMNRLKERNLSDAAVYRLAAAYKLAGQHEAAIELARKGDINIAPYRELSNTYGSRLRDMAMILETLCHLDETSKAAKVAKEISEQLSSGKWMSTQTTAYALIAMARFVGVDGQSRRIDFNLGWQNEKLQSKSSNMPIVQQPLEIGKQTEATITLKNTSGGSIFPRIIMEGLPAPGTETAAQNGMSIDVKYVNLKGRTIIPDTLEQGTDFAAIVTVGHTGTESVYEEIALSHLVASGWEIHNKRMDLGDNQSSGQFEYQDIRDDRVYTYFDLKRKDSKTFEILLNASYLGRFYLPMVTVETMYDATINARIPGKWVTVVRPSE